MIVPIAIGAVIAMVVIDAKKDAPAPPEPIIFHTASQMAIDKSEAGFVVKSINQVEGVTQKTWGTKSTGESLSSYEVNISSPNPSLQFAKPPISKRVVTKEDRGRGVETNNKAVSFTAGEANDWADTEAIDNMLLFKVHFSIASSLIDADQSNRIKEAIRHLAKKDVKELLLIGFTSPDGTYAFNEKLAKSRAEAVKEFIESHADGFSISIIEHEAVGSFWKERTVEVYAK